MVNVRSPNHQLICTQCASDTRGRKDALCHGRRICQAFQIFAPAKSHYISVNVLSLILTAFLFAFWYCPHAFAQSSTFDAGVHVVPQAKPENKDNQSKIIKVDVDLVLVSVTVTDRKNRPITGLRKDQFAILEGNDPQQIRTFSSEDEPVSLGVILDISASMSNKIEKAKEAVVTFLKTANSDDEFFLIAFSDRPELVSDFTTAVGDIEGKLPFLNPNGQTALVDAIYLGLNHMKQAKYRKKALLVISDGGDNHSRYKESEIESSAEEADVEIYSIGIFDSSPESVEELYGPHLLGQLCEVTGGRLFQIDRPTELVDVANKIGIELRNQYVLGYRPSNSVRDGKWRKIKVRLKRPKGSPPLKVYAKSGYYAASQ